MPRNSQPKIQIDRCCRRGRTTRHEKCQFPSPGLLVVGYNRPEAGILPQGQHEQPADHEMSSHRPHSPKRCR